MGGPARGNQTGRGPFAPIAEAVPARETNRKRLARRKPVRDPASGRSCRGAGDTNPFSGSRLVCKTGRTFLLGRKPRLGIDLVQDPAAVISAGEMGVLSAETPLKTHRLCGKSASGDRASVCFAVEIPETLAWFVKQNETFPCDERLPLGIEPVRDPAAIRFCPSRGGCCL